MATLLLSLTKMVDYRDNECEHSRSARQLRNHEQLTRIIQDMGEEVSNLLDQPEVGWLSSATRNLSLATLVHHRGSRYP